MMKHLETAIKKIEELSRKKRIKVISHYDTDGITSAAIFSKALSNWNKEFYLEIVKGLDEDYVKKLSDEEILIFLDLASGSLNYLKEKKTDVFIFDHHEIVDEIPNNVFMVNPILENKEQLCGSAICYMFAKTLALHNRDLATLALIGTVGDLHDIHGEKFFNEILKDAETLVKKGLLIYPSTRPLDKALEYSSGFYIPGVTGNYKAVVELLRDAGIENKGQGYKALYELKEDEMGRLITAIMLRCTNSQNHEQIIGNLYLVKFFNKLEDARELSALINACSRMDKPNVALGFCLGNRNYRQEAEKIYAEYKQSLVSALKYIFNAEKISGKDYIIINAKDKIKDTIIGTVASIVSHSPVYKEGLVIIALAYDEDKIKVSARLSGRNGRNVREVLHKAILPLGGEVGGHANAAGCLLDKNKEEAFIKELKNVLDVELIKL